jgi:hypothetical protein
LDRAIVIVCAQKPATPLCEDAGIDISMVAFQPRDRVDTPAACPIGDGKRINLFRALALGERVGKAGTDLYRSPMKRFFSCAISAM